MTHVIFHAMGWACLLAIFAIAVRSMVQVVAPQWRRILSLAAGNIEPSSVQQVAPDAHSTERLA